MDLLTKPTITVQVKQVYGRDTIYPHDTNAKLFADLVGQRTLTTDNLRIIKQLGYEVHLHQADFAL